MPDKRTFDLTKYWPVLVLLFWAGFATYRNWDDIKTRLFSPAMNPESKYTVHINPPQRVYGCNDEKAISIILMQTDVAAGDQMFETLRQPNTLGVVRCDYLRGMTGQYLDIDTLPSLTFVREAFIFAAEPELGQLAGAELSVRLYRQDQTNPPIFMLLAHPKIDGVFQEWAIDYLALRHGQQ